MSTLGIVLIVFGIYLLLGAASLWLVLSVSSWSWKEKPRKEPILDRISKETAYEALDALDDYARMETGVDAYGPRTVLERFIKQQND